jgi:hypothetical protein
MAQVISSSDHQRHRHGELAQPTISGRVSSLSVRSLNGIPFDTYSDDGAYIPDIPIRRLTVGRVSRDKEHTNPKLEVVSSGPEPTKVSPGPVNPNSLVSMGNRM